VIITFLNTFISRSAGGIFEVQRRLVQNLMQIPNMDIRIFGAEEEHTKNDLDLWKPFVPTVYETIGPKSLCFSPRLIQLLKNSNPDLVHLHVLWLYPSVAALKSRLPYMTTVHGMLDSWALKNSRLKKKMVALLYEKAALNKASCLQAFTKQEYNDIRNFGLRNPVCLIPNGVDIPLGIDKIKKKSPVWNNFIGQEKKVLLYLGRIHHKKGLTNLIRAWKKTLARNNTSDWVLAIAGWSQGGYLNELKHLSKDLDLGKSIFFLGPQFNENKELCFAHADAFILPSFSEGLPMAVLEAWSYGLPVLITRQCNLPEGFEYNAAIQIDASVDGIAKGLCQLFSLSEADLHLMGGNGKHLVSEKFSWSKVADELHKVYQWILGGGSIPENIILD
jgi:poly(glycerol-phosphate) alpha-glucosyltransferase